MKVSRYDYTSKCVSLLLLPILFPLHLYAQTNTVELKVVDADNGNGIEAATVQWKPIGVPSFKNGALTNRCGIVQIQAKGVDSYVVLTRYVGYETAIDTLKSSIKKHTIRLRANARELDGVVVTGKSKVQFMRESPKAITVINGKDLQGRSVSLETILDKTIGLKVGQTGGLGSSSRIIVHGLEGNRIQILWDGIPMSTSDGTFSLDEIPIDIIERIEVYKSIIPARFGCDGLGGSGQYRYERIQYGLFRCFV